jgi:hypothetical protein
LGTRLFEYPVTPDRILKALGKTGSNGLNGSNSLNSEARQGGKK